LLKELAPRITRVAVVINPNNFDYRDYPNALGSAANQAGVTLIGVQIGNVSDLRQAFATLADGSSDAILLTSDPLLTASDEIGPKIIEWASNRRVPLASPSYRVAPGGGLLSLSTDIEAPARRAAFYVHRILKGALPAELPVERPTSFKLVVNGKTAATLGLAIPQSVLLRADAVLQ